MIASVLVEANHHYDFSGIDGNHDFDIPLYAAAAGTPVDEDYRYAEVYLDGTLRLRGNMRGYPGTITFFNFNPSSGRGYFADFCNDSRHLFLPQASQLLLAAGVHESVFDATIMTETVASGDPSGGSQRDSAHRLAGVALNALQFARWYNYNSDSDHDPNMTRRNYALAIGTIVGRFGEQVLASEAVRLIGLHFDELHSALHEPGLPLKPHSDGQAKNEDYMDVARQVIRDTHDIPRTMKDKGLRVNFLSLFGDADFWAVTRDAHPHVFTTAVDHILAMPDPYTQPETFYCQSSLISPVGLIQSYFASAYNQIAKTRPDFKSDTTKQNSLIII